MGVFQNNLLAGAAAAASAGGAGFYDYQIEQSCRFDKGSSSYLARTPSGAGSSATTLTISFWFKRGDVDDLNMYLFTAYSSSSSRAAIFIYPDDSNTGGEMQSFGFGNSYTVKTNAKFREFSGWSHLVLRIDTTQSTANNRVRMYLNGNQLTLATNTQPSQNNTLVWNTAIAHTIGGYYSGQVLPYDGYFAEFIVADGQSYAPTQFGESKNGVWIPKDPSGTTFGNNGFHLKFENASDLGNDSSGNNNDFTVNNMGADHQVLDSPTFGS